MYSHTAHSISGRRRTADGKKGASGEGAGGSAGGKIATEGPNL